MHNTNTCKVFLGLATRFVHWVALGLTVLGHSTYSFAGRLPSGFLTAAQAALIAPPHHVTGKVYEQGSNRTKHLFNFEKRMVTKGLNQVATVWWRYPDGKEAAVETIIYEDGKLVKYELDQQQCGEKSTAEVQGDKIKLIHKEPDDVDESTEKYTENTIVVDQIPYIMGKYRDQLTKGETVDIKLAIPDHTDTFSFFFKKEREDNYQGTPTFVIMMKASSAIVRTQIDPIYFTFEKEGKNRLREIDGRMPLKKKVGKKWKDLDAVLVLDSY